MLFLVFVLFVFFGFWNLVGRVDFECVGQDEPADDMELDTLSLGSQWDRDRDFVDPNEHMADTLEGKVLGEAAVLGGAAAATDSHDGKVQHGPEIEGPVPEQVSVPAPEHEGAAEKASEPKKAEALKESEPQKAAQLQRKPSRDGSVFLSSPEKDDEQPETVFKRPSAHSVKKRPAAADGVKNVKVLKRPAAAQPPEDEPKEEPKVLKRPAAAQPPEDKPKDEPKEEPKSEVKEKCKESWAYPSADQRFTDKSGKWEVGMGQFKKFFSTFVQGMVSS